MSKLKLQEMLTRRLGLVQPVFRLEQIGAKRAGSIISDTFKGKSDRQRLHMIWNTLEAELGAKSIHEVGTLLAYTRDEWDIDLSDALQAKVV